MITFRYAERMKKLSSNLVFLAVAWLRASGPVAGQSISDLRQKYGEPISETFIASPDISVTARFEITGRITDIVISPTNTDLIQSRNKVLTASAVKLIIDQLVPRDVRGKHLINGFINATCLPENDCYGTSEIYERVEIYYNAAAEGRVHYAVIHMKD